MPQDALEAIISPTDSSVGPSYLMYLTLSRKSRGYPPAHL